MALKSKKSLNVVPLMIPISKMACTSIASSKSSDQASDKQGKMKIWRSLPACLPADDDDVATTLDHEQLHYWNLIFVFGRAGGGNWCCFCCR
jgi:hypothetical protein